MKTLVKSALLLLLVTALIGCGEEDSTSIGYPVYSSETYCIVKELQKCITDRCVDYLSEDNRINKYCFNWGHQTRLKNKGLTK